jgi:hypothetical protein
MALPAHLRHLDPLLDLMVEAVIEDLHAGRGGDSWEEVRHHRFESLAAPEDRHEHEHCEPRRVAAQQA